MFHGYWLQRAYQTDLSLSNATILRSRGLNSVRDRRPDGYGNTLCDSFREVTVKKPFLLNSIIAVCLLATQSYADSISCDGGIVSNGDTAVGLIMKCGQPEWKESRAEEIIDTSDKDVKRKTYITVEEWTYNFGPQQFLRVVTLRNGVITGVRTGTNGASKGSDAPGPACGDRVISAGDTKADILIKCGEPFSKSSHQEELKERLDDSSSRKAIVTVEEWTYNFGPQRFMRVITFRDGTVVDIRTAGYGR